MMIRIPGPWGVAFTVLDPDVSLNSSIQFSRAPAGCKRCFLLHHVLGFFMLLWSVSELMTKKWYNALVQQTDKCHQWGSRGSKSWWVTLSPRFKLLIIHGPNTSRRDWMQTPPVRRDGYIRIKITRRHHYYLGAFCLSTEQQIGRYMADDI